MNDEGIKVDLHLDGILWLVNRAVFHPRGYALGHDPETHEFVLLGDGSEPWAYDPSVNEDGLLAAVEAMFARARRQAGVITVPGVLTARDARRLKRQWLGRRWWQRGPLAPARARQTPIPAPKPNPGTTEHGSL